MSSEMRELVAKWREMAARGPDPNYDEHGIGPEALASCADELEALLARGEAGADGDKGPWRWKRTGSKVDVYSDDFTHDVALRIDGDFASEADADVYAAWLAGRLNTHPQDASGDAENSRRYLKLKELFRARFHRSTCDYWVIEGECKTDPRFFGEDAELLTLDAALDAMQAKEAK